MADKTFGVKVSEELYDKVKVMIENSGDSAKEWFDKAVSLAELQSIKQGATAYNQDLNELEVHTARIYELVSNMVQRSIYIKDHAVKEIADKLEQKESIIGQYQEKVKAALEELQQAQDVVKVLEQDKKELTEQLEGLRSINGNNQLLIHEYKEKNDTLSGLVTEYKGYAEENKHLTEQFASERDRLQSQMKEISAQNDKQQEQIKKLTRELETLKANHINELNRLTERMDYEKNKALLEIEREYQQKLLKSSEEYNARMKEMYEEIHSIRKEYEDKLKRASPKQPPNPNNRRG